MKKIFLYFLAVLILPFAILYAIPRYIYLNRDLFRKMVDYRSLVRQHNRYLRKYHKLQMELYANED